LNDILFDDLTPLSAAFSCALKPDFSAIAVAAAVLTTLLAGSGNDVLLNRILLPLGTAPVSLTTLRLAGDASALSTASTACSLQWNNAALIPDAGGWLPALQGRGWPLLLGLWQKTVPGCCCDEAGCSEFVLDDVLLGSSGRGVGPNRSRASFFKSLNCVMTPAPPPGTSKLRRFKAMLTALPCSAGAD